MLRVLAESERMHRLELSDGTPVGWVCAGTIGLHGFADEERAIAAVSAAWRALDAVLRHQYETWPRREPAFDQLRVVRDGWQAWISDPDRPLARLLRLEEAPRPRVSIAGERRVSEGRQPAAQRRDCLAIEFDVPSYVSLGALVAAARLMGRALQESEHLTQL